MRLSGKNALVTGGGRGIGFAIATAFVREGARVVIADVDLPRAQTTAEQLGKMAYAVHVDVASAQSISVMLRAVLERVGQVDILVNNAGIGGNRAFLDTSLEEWERIIRINLTGAFLVAQGVARAMRERGEGGKIINIASLAAQRGGEGRAAYGAAKAGLDILTRVMAVELSAYGINVNSIAPGPIETEMAKVAHDPVSRAVYNFLVPMGRYGSPEEIADAAVFLASDESRYVQGHTLNVDGGFRAAGLMYSKKLPGSSTEGSDAALGRS
jgi:NAD(P)-dependent dehydrogenase (short-subunit alcohol dehydrogenase family)